MDYTSLWEAFAGGGTWAESGALGPQTDYGARTTEFYDEIVGPAFGYDTVPDVAGDPSTIGLQGQFGTEYTGLMANINRYALDRGEEEFRIAIGDPYGRGDASDPFAWENVSRMKTYEGVIGEAQQMLEGELYHKGDELGGSTGAAYTEGIEGGESAYHSGLLTAREYLSYEGLTSGVGLQSGTSGATIRSGAGTGQAEDVLIEAYKDARTLSGALGKTKEKTELGLKEGLDAALKKYTDIIRTEKEDWFEDIKRNVMKVQGMGTEDEPSTVFTSAREDWDASQYEGLTYADTFADLETQVNRGFSEDVCGIGELWDGSACVPIEGLTKNEYDELIGEGGLYPGCTDPNATNYQEHAETDNGSCIYSEDSTPNWDDVQWEQFCNENPTSSYCGGNGEPIEDYDIIDTQWDKFCEENPSSSYCQDYDRREEFDLQGLCEDHPEYKHCDDWRILNEIDISSLCEDHPEHPYCDYHIPTDKENVSTEYHDYWEGYDERLEYEGYDEYYDGWGWSSWS